MAEQTSIGANDGTIATPVGSTPSTGPFAVDFPFDNLDDVIVAITTSAGVTTTLSRGSGYTLAATANNDGLYPSGTVTLVAAVSNVTVTRYRRTPLERTSQLPVTGYLDRAALNSDLNRMMMAMQDFDRRYGQYIRLPDGDPVVDAMVPDKATRAGKAFLWDGDGKPAAGTLAATNIALNSYWQNTVLPTSNAASARGALGAAGLVDANNFTAAGNLFAQPVTFVTGASFLLVSPIGPTPALHDDSSKIPTTAWVQNEIDAKLANPGGSTTVPTIVELLAGTGTWTVPAGTKWFDIEMVGGGGGGGSNVSALAGSNTVFDGIAAVGGGGGSLFFGKVGSHGGGGGPGGIAGSGGTGTGTATRIVRRSGNPGANGTTAGPLTVDGTDVVTGWAAVGGNGAASLLGGSPGKGGTIGAGTAGAANSGAGGGGWGSTDGNGGAGGGGSGEYVLARYATPAASYGYTVGAGATAGGNNSAGGSGYIRIRCHFNY